MPRYLIERNFAEALGEATAEAVRDRRRSYCLYEAPNKEAILRAAERAGVPADVIIEVDELDPAPFLAS